MPVGRLVEIDLAPRANAVDPVAGLRGHRPLGAGPMHAMRDDVQLERGGARIVPTDGVAPRQRSLATTQHEHEVLTGLVAEVLESVAGEQNATHSGPEIGGIDDFELERSHTRDP